MSTRKVTLTADTTRYQEALKRIEVLATYDREQRRYRTPPGLRTDVTDEAIETHSVGPTWPAIPAVDRLATSASDQFRQAALLQAFDFEALTERLREVVAVFDTLTPETQQAILDYADGETLAADDMRARPRRYGRDAQASPWPVGRRRKGRR